MDIYVINFNDNDTKMENLKLLNGKYKVLEHDLDVINNNNVKVIICLIKDEQIMGYNLSVEDYNNKEGKEITKRVDLTYLCEKIFPIENMIKSIKDKYKKNTNH